MIFVYIMYLPLVSTKYKSIFFWNPKCGCSNLADWFIKTNPEVAKDIPNLKKYARDSQQYIAEIHLHFALQYKTNTEREKLSNSNYNKYLLYRNPYSRLVSYFINHIKLNDHYRHTSKFGATNFNKQMSFTDFVNVLYLNKNTINRCPDIHLRQQSKNIKDIKFNKKINLKFYDKEINEICEELKIDILPNNKQNCINKTSYKENFHWSDLYNQNLYKKVNEIYEDDFHFLNIEMV